MSEQDWKARADALYNLSKEWERKAEFAAEQYRRRNAEAHVLEEALKAAREQFRQIVYCGNESKCNPCRNQAFYAVKGIDAALASQEKER